MSPCPECQTPVEPEAHACPACGASLLAPSLAGGEPDEQAPPPGGFFEKAFRFAKSFRWGGSGSFSFSAGFDVRVGSKPPGSDPVEPPQ